MRLFFFAANGFLPAPAPVTFCPGHSCSWTESASVFLGRLRFRGVAKSEDRLLDTTRSLKCSVNGDVSMGFLQYIDTSLGNYLFAFCFLPLCRSSPNPFKRLHVVMRWSWLSPPVDWESSLPTASRLGWSCSHRTWEVAVGCGSDLVETLTLNWGQPPCLAFYPGKIAQIAARKMVAYWGWTQAIACASWVQYICIHYT